MSDEQKRDSREKLRKLPSVDRLLLNPELADARQSLPHDLIVEVAREALEDARQALLAGKEAGASDRLAHVVAERLAKLAAPSLQHVINASGVIIHTNLGRAPLSKAAIAAMAAAASYSNLEYDLDAGLRGSRYAHAAPLLARLTGAEDALVVNNAAAALFFTLTAFAQGREVVLSRGQAVEIGGGFRIPDIMAQSGAVLREVGTTNRTYLRDYEAALNPQTAGLLRVHASNFKVVGFTTQPALREMAELAHAHGLWLLDDVGSGAFLPTEKYGLAPEPMVEDSINAGADLVVFSGDKLLGGPQAGLIVGKRQLVAQLRKHPLARALRVDKVTYAGLEATLLHYLYGEAPAQVPVWRMIAATEQELEQRAHSWAAMLPDLPAYVVQGRSAVGGGSLPGETLPTWLLAIAPYGKPANLASLQVPNGEETESDKVSEKSQSAPSPSKLATLLRCGRPAVVARVEQDMLLLDPRTIQPDEDEALLAALRAAWIRA